MIFRLTFVLRVRVPIYNPFKLWIEAKYRNAILHDLQDPDRMLPPPHYIHLCCSIGDPYIPWSLARGMPSWD